MPTARNSSPRPSRVARRARMGAALTRLLAEVERAGLCIEDVPLGEAYYTPERGGRIGLEGCDPARLLYTLAHEYGHHLQGSASACAWGGTRWTSWFSMIRARETDAWQQGERFVPAEFRAEYWDYAAQCLWSYGVRRDGTRLP